MPQQVNMSSDEILVWSFWPLAMQILSEIASTAPKAQQEPQVLWSLISRMDSHLGQAVAEKNSSGMSCRGSISLRGSLRCSGVSRVPISPLMVWRSMPSKYLLWPAVQLFWTLLTWSAIDLKSRKTFFSNQAKEATTRRHKTTNLAVLIIGLLITSTDHTVLYPSTLTFSKIFTQ